MYGANLVQAVDVRYPIPAKGSRLLGKLGFPIHRVAVPKPTSHDGLIDGPRGRSFRKVEIEVSPDDDMTLDVIASTCCMKAKSPSTCRRIASTGQAEQRCVL